MKFICTKENLLRGLSRVTPLAGKNTQLPILQNTLLQLKDGVLHLTCTDLEIGVHTTIPGKVEAEGSCTVSARKLIEYVQQLPLDNPLTLELKKNTLHLTTPRFRAQFPVTGDEDFPLLPHVTDTRHLTLNATTFCQGLTHTLFAAARDDTRPEIHSVYVNITKDNMRIAATDSFRLAEEIVQLDDEVEASDFLLPLSTAQEVVRLFGGYKTLKLIPHENHLAVQVEDLELSSRLVDGKYPDYQQIIPRQFVTHGTVGREELVRALKTLTVFLPRDSRRVQLGVKPRQSTLTLSVGGSDSGAGEVELEFAGSGDDLSVLFNIQYLLEGVLSLSGNDVAIKFVGSTDPAVCLPTAAASRFMYVVMPIQA